jgi:hypothetical protein
MVLPLLRPPNCTPTGELTRLPSFLGHKGSPADSPVHAGDDPLMLRKRRSPHRPGPQLCPPEVYLARMGRIWLWMVACFTLGIILGLAVGLGGAGLIAGVVPIVVLRGRWDRLMRNYSASMWQIGMEPLSIRDWSLVSESLGHVIQPSRPARSRTSAQPRPAR